jgi:hypothetical protein
MKSGPVGQLKVLETRDVRGRNNGFDCCGKDLKTENKKGFERDI